MEFGGGRKRGRPEASLNGNGGHKKSKPGSPSHFYHTYTRTHKDIFYVPKVRVLIVSAIDIIVLSCSCEIFYGEV